MYDGSLIRMRHAKGKSRVSANRTALTAGKQEDFIGHSLWEVYFYYVKLLTARTHSSMMDLNLTQWRTLTFIRYNPDQTQNNLARAVGIHPSSMTPIIDLFERRNWIRRLTSKGNRSAHGIRMTRAGLRAYGKVYAELKKAETRILAGLGARDRKKLNELLHRVRAHLETEL